MNKRARRAQPDCGPARLAGALGETPLRPPLHRTPRKVALPPRVRTPSSWSSSRPRSSAPSPSVASLRNRAAHDPAADFARRIGRARRRCHRRRRLVTARCHSLRRRPIAAPHRPRRDGGAGRDRRRDRANRLPASALRTRTRSNCWSSLLGSRPGSRQRPRTAARAPLRRQPSKRAKQAERPPPGVARSRPHAGKPAHPRAAREPHEQGLGLIVGMVRGRRARRDRAPRAQ